MRHWLERHCTQLVEVDLGVNLVVDLAHDCTASGKHCSYRQYLCKNRYESMMASAALQ